MSNSDTEDIIPASQSNQKHPKRRPFIRKRKRKATTHVVDDNEAVNSKMLMKLNKDKAWQNLRSKRNRSQSQINLNVSYSSSSDECEIGSQTNVRRSRATGTGKTDRNMRSNDKRQLGLVHVEDSSDSDIYIDLPSVLKNKEKEPKYKNAVESQNNRNKDSPSTSSDMSNTEWERYIASLTNLESPKLDGKNEAIGCRDEYVRDSPGTNLNDSGFLMFSTPDFISGEKQAISDNVNASPSSPVFHSKVQRKQSSVINKRSPKTRQKHKIDDHPDETQVNLAVTSNTDNVCSGDNSIKCATVTSPDVVITGEQPSTSRHYSRADKHISNKKQTTLHSYKLPHPRSSLTTRNRDPRSVKHSNKISPKKTREATRSCAPEADQSVMVSPATQQAVEQFESDETLARRLQEELDREYASTLLSEPATNHSGPSSMRVNLQTQDPADRLAHELHMSERIAALSEYEWRLHQAVHYGQDLPDAPAGINTSIGEILDQEILEYLESGNNQIGLAAGSSRRRSSLMDRSPVRLRARGSRATAAETSSTATSRPSRSVARALGHASSMSPRRRADLQQLQAETDLIFRIGMMPDDEWQIYRHVHLDENTGAARRSRRGRRNARDLNLDTEIMNLLFQANQPVARGARGRSRRMTLENMDYEDLLALSEEIGDVKKKGLSSSEIGLLPTKEYKAVECDMPEQNKACNVCLCDYENGDKQRILPCFHEYHTRCIDKWLKNNANCPVCRKEVKLN